MKHKGHETENQRSHIPALSQELEAALELGERIESEILNALVELDDGTHFDTVINLEVALECLREQRILICPAERK